MLGGTRMRFTRAMRRLVLIGGALLAITARAGKDFSATADTAEAACAAANAAANEYARQGSGCYRACKTSACTTSNGKYTCQATAANHGGSCRKGGYTKATDPSPPPAAPTTLPVEFKPNHPTSDKATIIVVNMTDRPAVTE